MTKLKNNPLKEKSQAAVELLARWSYVAKGILFCGVGLLAALSVYEAGDPGPSRKQVLEVFMGHALGQVLVALMALALLGHTIWRLFEALLDPYDKGNSPGGLLHRLSYLLSGVSYASVGLTAGQLLRGAGTGPDNEKQLWVADALREPSGKWLVGLAGLVLLSWAGVQAKKAVTKGLYETLEIQDLSRFWRRAIRVAGAVGFMAQAVVLAGTGSYLLRAALTRDAGWVKNIATLFQLLEAQPYGAAWALLLAAGLFVFGLFMFVMARYFPLKLAKD